MDKDNREIKQAFERIYSQCDLKHCEYEDRYYDTVVDRMYNSFKYGYSIKEKELSLRNREKNHYYNRLTKTEKLLEEMKNCDNCGNGLNRFNCEYCERNSGEPVTNHEVDNWSVMESV